MTASDEQRSFLPDSGGQYPTSVTVSDLLPEVVFWGGPSDGQACCMRAPLNDRILTPMRRGILAALESIDPTKPDMPVAVYELACTLGRPALDDAGRYRYRYVGQRS